MTPEECADEVARRLRESGVATVRVRDGRVLWLTVDVLRELLAKAEGGAVSLFIRDASSVQ